MTEQRRWTVFACDCADDDRIGLWGKEDEGSTCMSCGEKIKAVQVQPVADQANESGQAEPEPAEQAEGRIVELEPPEQIALIAARSALQRGENPPINTTTMLVIALERLSALSTEGSEDA